MNQEFCIIVGKVAAYLEKHPEQGAAQLKQFLDDDKLLYDTEDVMRVTGWGRTYVTRLCTTGQLPYIPGKPHKFIPQEVTAALIKMQIGAGYGRKKSKPIRRQA